MSSIGDDVKVGKLTVLKKVELQTDTDLEASRVLVKNRFEFGEGCEIVGLNETYATDQELANAEAHLQSNILVLQEKTDGLTSNLATEKTRIDGLVSSLSTTDAQVVNLNTTLGASVNALRTDVDSNANILSTLNYDVNTPGGVKSNVATLQSDLDALEAQTDLLSELRSALDPDDPNHSIAIASLTGAGAGLAGSIYSSILTRGVASTQGQIVDILEDQFGDTLDNLSNVSNVNSKTTSDVSALQDVVNLANWGRIPGSGTNYDFVITSPGNVGKNLTSNVIRFNHDLYGTTGKISQINSNITTIKSNLYTHDVLIALNADNLAQNVVAINNLSSDYTALNSSVLGAVATLGTLTSSGGTIDTIRSDLVSNVSRIELLESNIGSSGSSSNVTYTTVQSNLSTNDNVYVADTLTMGEHYTHSSGTRVRPEPRLVIHGQSRTFPSSLGTAGSTLNQAHILLTDTEFDDVSYYQGYRDFDQSRLYIYTLHDGANYNEQGVIQSTSVAHSNISTTTETTEHDEGSFTNEYGNDLLLNPYGGNVAIGMTNPSAKLHVNGDILGGCPVMFKRSTVSNTGASSYINWNKLGFEKGGGWTYSNFTRFYAPIPGYYYISVSVMSVYQAGLSATFQFQKNDVKYPNNGSNEANIYAQHTNSSGAYVRVSASTIMYLDDGDYMSIFNTGTASIHFNYGGITGFYLSN
jgi:hypothetical protein